MKRRIHLGAVLILVVTACGAEPAEPVVPAAAPAPTVTDEPKQETVPTPSPAPEAPTEAATEPPVPVVQEPPPGPRLGSVSHYTWVYKNTSRKQQPIGYVRPGTSVALESEEPRSGSDCQSGRWLAIKPTGFVCEDATVTLDVQSALFRALSDVVRPRDHVLPYRYGYSTGAPMYGRFPSDKEREREAREFGRVENLPRSGKGKTTYEELTTYDPLSATDPVPTFAAPEMPRLRGYGAGLTRKTIPAGSLLSFSHAVESEGRTYLLSPDLTLVPADRIRPFRQTTFRGVAIGGEVQLPIGWIRSAPRAKYRKLGDGGMEVTGDTWPPRTMLRLTGGVHVHKGQPFHETREGGLWVRGADVSVVESKASLPSTVREGEKWIEFSASKGTFTLYVGKDAVYSTLGSPGRGGGAPTSKMSIEDLVQGSYTPLGTYRVTFKTRSTTMTPESVPNPQKHWIQDVPYTQYFIRPFAIHTAYWHEDFGAPKSGGCINLSPVDARHVFGWTDPPVPEEWSGVSSSTEMGLGTTIVIRR